MIAEATAVCRSDRLAVARKGGLVLCHRRSGDAADDAITITTDGRDGGEWFAAQLGASGRQASHNSGELGERRFPLPEVGGEESVMPSRLSSPTRRWTRELWTVEPPE
jgi:hypothetical protein